MRIPKYWEPTQLGAVYKLRHPLASIHQNDGMTIGGTLS